MRQLIGEVRRALPTSKAEGALGRFRTSRYGELLVARADHAMALADEGSYFKAVNPTPATGIPMTIQTSFVATDGLVSLRNGASAGGKRLYLDYLRLIVSVAPAAAVRSELLIALDNITRYSSGGSAITPVNANMDSDVASGAVLHFGALTLAAASANVRNIARAQLRGAAMVIYEEHLLKFGNVEPGNVSAAINSAQVQRQSLLLGPAVIGPGQVLLVHLWNPSNAVTPPSFEFEMGWAEK